MQPAGLSTTVIVPSALVIEGLQQVDEFRVLQAQLPIAAPRLAVPTRSRGDRGS